MASILKGPDGRSISPEKTFLVDGNGNRLSPADKDFAVPTYLTMSSLIAGAEQTYLAGSYDEALKHSQANAWAMLRDCRIQGWMAERYESVVNLKWHLEVENEKDPLQKCVKDGLTRIFRRIPRFKRILRSLMKALWYGRYAAEVCWRYEEMDLPALPQKNLFEELAQGMNGMNGANGQANGQLGANGQDSPEDEEIPLQRRNALVPFKSRPLNGDKINYTWGETPGGAPPGTPLVRIYPASGEELDDAEIVYDNMGPLVALTGPWRERFIIHNYDPDDADYFLPEMAGGIHGVGIRSRIYWLNWIRMEYAAWIQDLFDRVGLGFICIKYDMASDKARQEAEKVAKKWNRRSVLAIPVTPDQLQKAGSIEVVEVPTTGAVVVQELVRYLDLQVERYILRQTMSGGGASTGDGARGTVGPAEMAKNTETQRIKADAEELAETITGDGESPGLLSTILKWSYPNCYGMFPVYFRFDVEDTAPKDTLQAISVASGLGVTFKTDEIRDLTGMSKPSAGDETCGGQNRISTFGEDAGSGGPSASEEAAHEWIDSGKPKGSIETIAKKHGITKQAVASESKRIEGGG